MIPKYKRLVEAQYEREKEVTILLTPYCEGGCNYCLYDRSQIGDREYDKLMYHTYNYLYSLDLTKQNAAMSIEGGELLSPMLIKDKKYVAFLFKILYNIQQLVKSSKKSYMAISTSLENIDEDGVAILKELNKRFPSLHINVAFTEPRIYNNAKKLRFWNNLRSLRDNHLGIGVLMTEGFPEREYLRTLLEFSPNYTVDFAEPHMFKDFVWDYGDIDIPEIYNQKIITSGDPKFRRGMPSLHHLDIYITSDGIKNGFHLLNRPEWIDVEEWNRLRDDEEYRLYGYQQVLDWYNCNECPYLMRCQNMLWTSYYAQKKLFNNRRCIYK